MVNTPFLIDRNPKISLTTGQKQKNHARNYKTSLKEFLVLTKREAAQLKKAAKSGAAKAAAENCSSLTEMSARGTPSEAVRAQGEKRAIGTGTYRP